MKRSLLIEVFLGMVAVALLSVGIAGLIVRSLAGTAFRTYLDTLPGTMGMGTGRRMMLTGAEQTFMDAVNNGILIGAIGALVIAALAALLLAWYLTRPLERLTEAANALAAGELAHRVDARGPLEVERLGTAFNEMAQALDDAETLRRRLVADVAHELRNPIAALRAQIEGIAEGVLVADERRLTSIADDARYLTGLVNDLQELSAADAGQLRYDLQPLDLATLACRETDLARERAPRPGPEIDCETPGPLWVTGDEGRLRQVLRNLLDNALRHTAQGSIRVVCAPEGDAVRVEVRDTGEGIPFSDLPHIFERFYRADSARSRDTGGAGIGLSITRRIVEDHGGEVFARNAESGGATVGFSLPATREA